MAVVTVSRHGRTRGHTCVGPISHACPVAVERETAKPWHWWRQWWHDESWWRGVAEKAAAALIHSSILAVVGVVWWKPWIAAWVFGVAVTGLVALGLRWLARRVRAHRAARAARAAHISRHARVARPPLPFPPGQRSASPPPHPLPRRRSTPSGRRPAAYLAVAAAGAILVNLVVPDDSEGTPLHEQPSYTTWYDQNP